MSGAGVLLFETSSGGAGSGLDYVRDAFADISLKASNNSGFSSTVSRNPLENYYANDDAPRWAAKTLWIKDLVLEQDRTLWVSDRPTYRIIWNEEFPAAKGYVFGAVDLAINQSGTYLDINRIGDGAGVGGVIRRVQWIVDSRSAATATAQLKLDGSNVTTIDFSTDAQNWSGQVKYNAYTSAASNETRDIHDYQLVAIQASTLRITGVVVYYEITGSQIDCFGGTTYIDKAKITTVGTSLAIPALNNFRGGRSVIYKTITSTYGITTTPVTDVTSVATGSSGTNLLTVQSGHGASFLAGTVVYGAVTATHYVGNVLSISGDVLTMGVTLPQGLSTTIYQVLQAGHTFSVDSAISLVDWDFKPYVGVTVPTGILAFQDPTLRYRVWGDSLSITTGTTLASTLGSTLGIALNNSTSFLQVDGKYQSLEFEFLAGASGYIQATFGIDGLRCFNIDEAFSGPGIFRKVIQVGAGPGWHSVVMNRGASNQQVAVSRIIGYRSSSTFNGPSFGQLAKLDFGQTFLLRDSVNATLTAFGNVQRLYADSLYVKGPWVKGITNVVAGGVFFHGSTTTSTLRMQYYGSAVAFVGAIGTSNSITIDGLAQTAAFGSWLGLSLATDFHTLAFSCNGGTTRLEAIDFLSPGQIVSNQNFAPLDVDLPDRSVYAGTLNPDAVNGQVPIDSLAADDELLINDFSLNELKKIAVSTMAASQAEQEAGSAIRFVTPTRQQFHPSAFKAWAKVNVSGGAPTIAASYNVTSITDNGAGDFTINFTVPFSSANYGYFPGGEHDAGTAVYSVSVDGDNPQTGSAFRLTVTNAAGTPSDPRQFSIGFAGDQ